MLNKKKTNHYIRKAILNKVQNIIIQKYIWYLPNKMFIYLFII